MFASHYLKKQKDAVHFSRAEQLPQAGMLVIIPCMNEPLFHETLMSLSNCWPPESKVIVLVVVNHGEKAAAEVREQNRQTLQLIETMKHRLPAWLQVESVYAADLPEKHAGAGLARKLGMDWALAHFNRHQARGGILISLDADTLVEPSYFTAIENFYRQNTECAGAVHYFEHPLDEGKAGEAMALYELYLRYHQHAVEYTGFPHAMYTLGSCFSVRAAAYVAQGGMNRRKAGEDFYFLQKLAAFGPVGFINSTTVRPSARCSDRVPFGTGPALSSYLSGNKELALVYPLEAYAVLSRFFQQAEYFYTDRQAIGQGLCFDTTFSFFAQEMDLVNKIENLLMNCASAAAFKKRFFHLFNAFFIVKWLNFALQHGFSKKSLPGEAARLLQMNEIPGPGVILDVKSLLNEFRILDKTR
jgi:hypothetical protein